MIPSVFEQYYLYELNLIRKSRRAKVSAQKRDKINRGNSSLTKENQMNNNTNAPIFTPEELELALEDEGTPSVQLSEEVKKLMTALESIIAQ